MIFILLSLRKFCKSIPPRGKKLFLAIFLLKIRYSCKKIKLIFSFALHDLKNLSYLRKLNPDMVFLSPIFKTSSHQNQRPLGLFNYIKIAKIFNQKIAKNNFFPLGGINLQNLRRLNKINITGFGAIDFFKNL